MEKDNRRNSILKPTGVLNQLAGLEHEEEQTENFPFARRRSMKRVSFSVKDEIKEFQKHEALNVEKLEQALNMMQNSVENTSNSFSMLQKENLGEIIVLHKDFSDAKDPVDDMEISASTAAAVFPCLEAVRSSVTGFMIQQNISSQEELNMMDASLARQTTSNDVHMLMSAVCRDENPKLLLESTHPLPLPLPLFWKHDKECQPCQPGVQKHAKMCRNFADSCVLVERSTAFHKASSIVHNFIEDELGEFHQLLKDYHWKVSNTGGQLILSKLHNCIILKFHLSNEYIYQNVRHYIVNDVEIDTKKGMEDKWAKLGLAMLETTLENNCSVKSVSRTTQELTQLVVSLENYFQFFLEFIIKDSEQFELLVNPRSLKIDLDGLELSFDLSNEQNLVWVRITLTLNPTIPISARSVMIENVMGNTNKTELSNMILTIRPGGQYLTRVAECIEDFLKFRPNFECKILDESTL